MTITMNTLYRLVHSYPKRVYCAFCDWTGAGFVDGWICPKCNSKSRHRLIAYAIDKFGIALDGATFFHAGPNLNEIEYLNRKFNISKYYAFDRNEKSFINLTGDLTAIPLPDNSIDVVLAWHILEHVTDDRKAIAELHRILKPGGKMLASVPMFPANRLWTHEDPEVEPWQYKEEYGHPDHKRACGADYIIRLMQVFRVDELWIKLLPNSEQEHFGLSEDHVCWMCEKV